MKLIAGPHYVPSFRWRATSAAGLMLLSTVGQLAQAQVYPRPTYSSPIAISLNDHLIWTVNPGDNSVSVFRPDNNTRLAKITVGAEPQSLALTPDNQSVYVANTAGSSVTVIKVNDPAWGTFSAAVDTSVGFDGELTTGAEPWNVVCSPDGKRIFVA